MVLEAVRVEAITKGVRVDKKEKRPNDWTLKGPRVRRLGI